MSSHIQKEAKRTRKANARHTVLVKDEYYNTTDIAFDKQLNRGKL